jgi:hypothetical protein
MLKAKQKGQVSGTSGDSEGPCPVTFSLPASKSRKLAYLPWQSALQTIPLSYGGPDICHKSAPLLAVQVILGKLRGVCDVFGINHD